MSLLDDLLTLGIASGKKALARAGQSLAKDVEQGAKIVEAMLEPQESAPRKVHVDVVNVEAKK